MQAICSVVPHIQIGDRFGLLNFKVQERSGVAEDAMMSLTTMPAFRSYHQNNDGYVTSFSIFLRTLR